jgi:hypothetical protein
MFLRPERRRHHAPRRMVPVPVAVFVLVEHQMLDQGLAVDALAGGPRPRDRLVRVPRRRMNHIEGTSGQFGHHDGPVGGLALDGRRARKGMTFGTGDSGLQVMLLEMEHHVAVFGVHQRHRSEARTATERVVQLVVVDHQGALVGHIMLEGVDAVGFDAGLHLIEDLAVPPRHRHVEAVVAGGALGFAAPILVGREQRLTRIGNAEIDHHGGAAG